MSYASYASLDENVEESRRRTDDVHRSRPLLFPRLLTGLRQNIGRNNNLVGSPDPTVKGTRLWLLEGGLNQFRQTNH